MNRNGVTEMVHEEFGDGIMSGKYLPYKTY